MMKNFISHPFKLVTIACCAVSFLVSCSKDETTAKKDFTVVTDRVIDITYDTYDEEKAVEFWSKYGAEMGGCSAVKVLLDGKTYVGRNSDYICSNAPAAIVRNNSGKIRTIGLCYSPKHFADWTNEKDYTLPEEYKDIIPSLCCDVLSEAGIYIESNIRVYEEETACTSTNPGKPRRCTQTFIQTMLSNYSTIQEMLEHINDYDWFEPFTLGFHQSLFLTDKTGYSVIIEFAKNQVYWQESNVNANYFINEDLYATEKYPSGELRIERELALYDSIQTPDDIFTMMKAGAYDQFYNSNVDIDYAIPEFLVDINYDRFAYAEDPEGARTAMRKVMQLILGDGELTWEQKIQQQTWETVFAIVANVSDLELNVHFSEHYNIDFNAKFE